MLNEKYCRQIIDLFDKEDIIFDAFYQRLKAFKRTDEYCNYNQIYLDFDLTNEKNDSETPKICENALVVAPISLDNDDIKDKEQEDLLF